MTSQFITEQGVQNVRDSLHAYPRPDQAAADALRAWASKKGLDLDPDKVDAVTLHYQIKGQRCIARIVQKVTMTQAMLSNWQGESDNNLVAAALHEAWAGKPPPYPITLVDHLDEPGLFDNGAPYSVYNGLYQQVSPATYDTTHHVRIAAEDFQSFIWDLDFHTAYTAMLKEYWKDGLSAYRDAAKVNFIAACNKQVANASLSDAGRILAWQIAGLQHRPHDVKVARLNIYGYVATNLLCLRNHSSGLTLLYIPGNSAPLHEFKTESAMKHWVAEQCKHSNTRRALEAHFAPGDEDDGLGFSGLSTALTGLGLYPAYHHFDRDKHPGFATSGLWIPDEIVNFKESTYSPPDEAGVDVFLSMARHQKRRSELDADFIITSDASVTQEKWRGYFDSAINTLAPIAMVVPELQLLFDAAGIIQFGFALERATSGKTLAQRAAGVEGAAWGLLNATPLLDLPIPEAPAIFRFKRPEFVMPVRINGQLGYPLSPLHAPHLPPIEPILETAFSLPSAVRPLAGGDQAIADAIIRVPSYGGNYDVLQCEIDGYVATVHYDVERNAFIQSSDLNHIDPPYYIAPKTGERSLSRLKDVDRPVTNADRVDTLLSLGVDLTLPVNLSELRPPAMKPIPKKISSIWIGNKPISPELLENVARNAALLDGTGYEYRLYLSLDSFSTNRALISQHAPTMRVMVLEYEWLFTEFTKTPYYKLYEAAMGGNSKKLFHHASAADVLRYRILKAEGGIYMDMDDSLLGLGKTTPFGRDSELIEQVPLETSSRGLILSVPMSNESLGMNIQYGNSMIGSHAHNPTLDAISETMLERFNAQPDFYESRPDGLTDPEGLQRFAATLNHITGPGALTDTIKKRLPEMAQYREIWNVTALPKRDTTGVINTFGFYEASDVLTPFNRFAKVGTTQSWAHT